MEMQKRKMVYRVVFVRHGESEWNKMNLFCGWNDVNLSEKGQTEARTISAASLKYENIVDFDIGFTSCLKRANQTLNIIKNELNLNKIQICKAWQLNERHYGALTGFNKREMADAYGEEQVQIWRRSFNVPPPPITPRNPYYTAIRRNPSFANVNEKDFPDTETLEMTMTRAIPFWENVIVPKIRMGYKVIVVAHGTSLRGLVKHIESMTNEEIMKFNLPNSIPFVYEFNECMKPIKKIRFLADDETVMNAIKKVASIGK